MQVWGELGGASICEGRELFRVGTRDYVLLLFERNDAGGVLLCELRIKYESPDRFARKLGHSRDSVLNRGPSEEIAYFPQQEPYYQPRCSHPDMNFCHGFLQPLLVASDHTNGLKDRITC